jgi:hypothetical protein
LQDALLGKTRKSVLAFNASRKKVWDVTTVDERGSLLGPLIEKRRGRFSGVARGRTQTAKAG